MKLPSFLITLFEYNWFAPVLFATIAVLTIIFFIVLFFGKKDEKERELENTKKLELASVNSFDVLSETPQVEESNVYKNPFDELNNNITEQNSIPQPIVEQEPVLNNNLTPFMDVSNIIEETAAVVSDEATSPFDNIVDDNKVDLTAFTVDQPSTKFEESNTQLDEPILAPTKEDDFVLPTFEAPIEAPIANESVAPEYDFDSLAASINKELEELERISKGTPEVSNPESVIETPIIPEVKPLINEEQAYSTPLDKTKNQVFSSVFVNPQKDMPSEYTNDTFLNNFNALLKEDKKEEKIELPKVSEEAPTVKPKFELPKRNTSTVEDKSNIITSADFPEFPNLTDEGYTFRK